MFMHSITYIVIVALAASKGMRILWDHDVEFIFQPTISVSQGQHCGGGLSIGIRCRDADSALPPSDQPLQPLPGQNGTVAQMGPGTIKCMELLATSRGCSCKQDGLTYVLPADVGNETKDLISDAFVAFQQCCMTYADGYSVCG
jgi:hypothetical protein